MDLGLPSTVRFKIDACLWTKNGESVLPTTLRSFDQVVPKTIINKRIMVDDHSKDGTISIGEEFGWQVHKNPGNGIADAANEALRHVTTPFFLSLEQDVILARDWFPRIFSHMSSVDIAVSQGIRIPTNRTLRAIWPTTENFVGYSIDNTIYRTEVLRMIGGFPRKCRVCTDGWLKRNIEDAGYRWIIDPTVVSWHIRSGVRSTWKHDRHNPEMCTCGSWRRERTSHFGKLLRLVLTSPLSGLKIAARNNTPVVVFAYPFYRLIMLQAWATDTMWLEHSPCAPQKNGSLTLGRSRT